MNEPTTLPSRKKSRSLAARGHGKPARMKAERVPAENSAQARTRLMLTAMTAFRDGTFLVRLPVDWPGLDGRIAETFNQTIAQKQRLSSEIARLSSEVGKDGRLKQRISLPGAVGGWAESADCINSLIDDLVRPTTEISRTIGAVTKGDLSKSIDLEVDGRALKGEFLRSAKLVNTMVDQLNGFALEVTRVAREVGTEGKLGGQAQVVGVAGIWNDLTVNVNLMAANLTTQVRAIAVITAAVVSGDMSKKITVDAKGELLALKDTVNTMVDQLGAFASEVTRVAREVGTEGKLGGQAQVVGVAGIWNDLTVNVNVMASNLTTQVRNIAVITTAVANGDLSKKITVDVKGEMLELKNTVNTMVDQLNGFSAEVTRVAREVGTEGKLGGQAQVPGAAGTWKDLTDNVNSMASLLTGQVRAIAEVATAVTKGELTRSIQVETRGEVAKMMDNINTMISNLRVTTESNREQDWLKTNLAKFAGMLQGQRELNAVGQMLLSELAPLINIHQGTIYQLTGQASLTLLASYAHDGDGPLKKTIRLGEGLVGQCAVERTRTLLPNVPPDFLSISSSLGEARRMSIIVLPVLFEGQIKAVIELASLQEFETGSLAFLELLTQSIGAVFNTIEATMRTESLLAQSQQLTVDLQSRQSELQQSNEALGTKAKLLAEQNAEVERKNTEVEQARFALEEKAAELALTSKYKSEFLANMSHELRTPLNSILILSQQLAGNAGGNLSGKQVEFSRNINSSGSDLLNLINDILDLSKIESGTVTVEVQDIPFAGLRDTIDRNFRHVAEAKNLPFDVQFAEELPRSLSSDPKRLQQILKNLLSNAVKFTTQGHVKVRAGLATQGWTIDHPVLRSAQRVIAFAVEDTGIGIATEKQRLIFEAFQQADAGTARKFGGTGLGLAISRELAALLGGEIKLMSVYGQGSTFTLFLPLHYNGPDSVETVTAIGTTDKPRPSPALTVLSLDRVEQIQDDRHVIKEGDSVLLIIENHPDYARILLDLARGKGFKGVVATGGMAGLALARQFLPTAISLDIFLPDMHGWTVLHRLKRDLSMRHIPVQIVTVEKGRHDDLAHGAFAYLVKEPTTEGLDAAFDRLKGFTAPRTKRLLIVEDHDIQRQAIVELLGHTDIETVAVATGREALAAMIGQSFDCVVLDLRLPDMSGFELLEKVHAQPALVNMPVIVFTGKELTAEEQTRLKTMAKSIILKDVRSPERLLDETSLFLHRVVADLPPEKQQMLNQIHASHEVLRGRTVLVVDDDARNIFALTSLLENQDMTVLTATNGRTAIDLIQNTRDLDIVLMDIMMPEMDGYETMREIRTSPEFRTLPILALTAKAMKGDREKCLDAGASDYIAKPVDTDQLLSLMRTWLFR